MKRFSFAHLQTCVLYVLLVTAITGVVMGTRSSASDIPLRSRAQQDGASQPNSQLSPEEVVRIVLEALQRNDIPRPDSGIATAFRFSSPGNRAATGPLTRFAQIVKTPNYLPLLGHQSAEREAAQIRERQARVLVTITSTRGERINYLFSLSKQLDASCRDCWMTDGVSRVRIERRRPTDSRRIASGRA